MAIGGGVTKMIKFLLLVNKQGQRRIVKYYEYVKQEDRNATEVPIIRKSLMRSEKECSFFEYKDYKVVFRRYATLYFIVGIDGDENELAILEFLHNIVETLDRYFNKVCELDIMYNLDRVHMMLDEMIVNGHIVESNKSRILAPIQVLDQAINR